MSNLLSGRTIGFIGAGNMAEAMIGALIQSELAPKEAIRISDPNPDRRAFFSETYQVATGSDNAALFHACDIILLAVKPQMMESVLTPITTATDYAAFPGKKLVISIAAGIPLSRFVTWLSDPLKADQKDKLALVRVMPNTPSLVGCGMSGLSTGPGADETDKAVASALVASMGKVRVVEEALLDAVTAVSGSGPAYVFLFIEAMIRTGEDLGLSPEAAKEMVMQTVKGAVALLESSDADAADLRARVTSPGGTTAAAITAFTEGGFSALVETALTAARDRSLELAKAP